MFASVYRKSPTIIAGHIEFRKEILIPRGRGRWGGGILGGGVLHGSQNT